MLEWAMSHPSFKTQLFRFVDVFPATHGDADVVRHLGEYLTGPDTPRTIDLGINLAEHAPFGKAVAAALARHNIAGIAHQFIVGSSPHEVTDGLRRLWDAGSAFTVDLLGEKTVTEAEADRYAARVADLLDTLIAETEAWPASLRLDSDDQGTVSRVNVSVKPSALASRYAPLTGDQGLDQAAARLRPILRRARDSGAFVHFDAEHYDVKDLTLRLVRDLLGEAEFAAVEAGVVIQAYLKDSYEDLADLIAFSSARPRPLTVRLVKGAYWDTETVTAQAHGWPPPVFEDKADTDANYEQCSRLLLDHHGQIRAAFASHNLRSLGHAVAYARSLGIADNGYEVQLLYGMAPPLHEAVRRLGLRLRVYCPVGELVPGMAYLVRRLLENTANESFVRRSFVEGQDIEALLAPPVPTRHQASDTSVAGVNASMVPSAPYRPEPIAEWRRPSVRAEFRAAVSSVGRGETNRNEASRGEMVPALINGERVHTAEHIVSVDPAAPSTIMGESASCGREEADAALAAAQRAQPAWASSPVAERAAVLFRAAAWIRSRRIEIAALEVYEAGKPWPDADADVCEAIDFLEYYGRAAIRLDSGRVDFGRIDSGRVDSGPAVESPPGESNRLTYEPRGTAVVISPWNFPLAIPTGMVAAALVTGNAVLFKPAEQTPVTAYRLVEALVAAGLPHGVLAFLPGPGESLGAYLVAHPDVSTIAFTGSRAVGLGIIEVAAATPPGQRHVKRVIAEMGGKNPIVVDDDADLDQTVPIVLASAFGYAGQKCSACSRLIVAESIHDQLVERLTGAAAGLMMGHPRESSVDIGPLIDAEARNRVLSFTDLASNEGRVVLACGDAPSDDERSAGWFVGPMIVTEVDPAGRLATEEIFGPILSVMRATSFDHALEVANASDYALTAGIVSRSPARIARAVRELRAGNVYVNRNITGAVVGRQPFGGYGLSGMGFKAGGPDYLVQFVNARAVSENTLRQGFAASSSD